MEITGISPQKKDKLRCNIEVDGRFYCGMKLETVITNRLKVGRIVTEEELSQLQLESEKTTALDKALVHITATMKTEKEIRDFLKRKGYLPDVSDYVIGRMKEFSLIDDVAYAKVYCESVGKKKGRRLIAVELKRKGIDDEAIAEAVETLSDEEESAVRILEKYMRGKPCDKKTLTKAFSYLISKGYEYDTARSALTAFGAEDED